MVSTPNEIDAALTAGATSPVGAFRYEPATDAWWWSDEVFRIFGLDPSHTLPTTSLVLDHIHPEEREHLQDARLDEILYGKRFVSLGRIVDAQGTERVVTVAGEAHRSPEDGSITHVTGQLVDITAAISALASSEATLQVHAAGVHRTLIDQAVGVTMVATGATPAEAFGILRDTSMHKNVKLRDLAARVMADASKTEVRPGSPGAFSPQTSGDARGAE